MKFSVVCAGQCIGLHMFVIPSSTPHLYYVLLIGYTYFFIVPQVRQHTWLCLLILFSPQQSCEEIQIETDGLNVIQCFLRVSRGIQAWLSQLRLMLCTLYWLMRLQC